MRIPGLDNFDFAGETRSVFYFSWWFRAFAGEVISGGQAHLRCDNSASMKQQRAGVISATSVLKIGPEPCTCSSHSEVMSASPSAYVGVGLQGNECDWLYYFQYFLPFFTLHAYCMLCFFNFVIFVVT